MGWVSTFVVGVLGSPYPFRYVMTAWVEVVRCAADESLLCAPSGGVGALGTAWWCGLLPRCGGLQCIAVILYAVEFVHKVLGVLGLEG